MLAMMKAIIAGLEHTYQNQGVGGSSSAFMVLEIMHTHYWIKEGSNKSDSSNASLVRHQMFNFLNESPNFKTVALRMKISSIYTFGLYLSFNKCMNFIRG